MKKFRTSLYGVEIVGQAKDRESFESQIKKMRRDAFSFKEHSQPTMQKISELVYDLTPCQAIDHVMSLRCDNAVGLNCQLKEMVYGVEAWLSENRDHLEVFSRFVNGFKIINVDEYKIGIDGLLNVNPDVEKRYLESVTKEDDKRIRYKMLAAISVIIQNEFLKCSTEDNDAASVGCHMFFLFRSFVQFASCSSHRKGVKHTELSQEGGKSAKQRDGFFALIRRVCPEFPSEKVSAPIAWEKIIAHLLTTRRATTYNGSKFYVLEDSADRRPQSCELREVRGTRRYEPIKFNTFRTIFGRLRKAHLQMEK